MRSYLLLVLITAGSAVNSTRVTFPRSKNAVNSAEKRAPEQLCLDPAVEPNGPRYPYCCGEPTQPRTTEDVLQEYGIGEPSGRPNCVEATTSSACLKSGGTIQCCRYINPFGYAWYCDDVEGFINKLEAEWNGGHTNH